MNRNYSIDFLRGIAIIGMVLASVIPYQVGLPGWMFHAQVGPPDFVFTPERAGISWVDLVFPFFLFAMGAAFPLAMQGKLIGKAYKQLSTGILRRGLLLVFFAITLAYLSPSNLTATPTVNYATALCTFGAYFLVFMRFEGSAWRRYGLQALGFLSIAALIYYHSEIVGNTFTKSKSNIILLVLANMAFFGGICWCLTYKHLYVRLAIMAAFMGIWLTRGVEGAWTAQLFEFHPSLHWMYNFAFLKYLCIVLPGSILGDLWLQYRKEEHAPTTAREASVGRILAVVSFLFVVFHVVTLYGRWLSLNLVGHLAFGVLYYLLFQKYKTGTLSFYRSCVGWGFALVSVALCFEPLDGGIKKDPSSFSYWFLTSGLAFVSYLFCDVLTLRPQPRRWIRAVLMTGQNPMIAYCVSACFITPVLGLLQFLPLLERMEAENPSAAWLRTVLFMGLMIFLTNIATRRKWFWRS